MPARPLVRMGTVRLGMALAQVLPHHAAYGLAAWLARLMRARRWRMFAVLRANLAHLPLGRPDDELDAMAERAVALALRTYYETLRAVSRGEAPQGVSLKRGELPAQGLPGWQGRGPGLVVGALHMSNFDLAGAWLASQGLDFQALSLAGPDLGTLMVNRLRRKQGLTLTPIEPASLRDAIRRLKAGGLVLTGIDRPVDEGRMPLPFFGQLTHMPVGHVRLALQTGARFMMAVCLEQAEGRYVITFSEPMELTRTGDREADIRTNALAILHLAEEIIVSAPEQWLVFRPVWPGAPQPETSRSVS